MTASTPWLLVLIVLTAGCRSDPNGGGGPGDAAPTHTHLVSAFDHDAQGWSISDNGAVTSPDYASTGGNPGGTISATDDLLGVTWYFRAPSSYLVDASSCYGRTLRFDMKTTANDSPFDEPDVRLSGGGVTLVCDAGPIPTTSWTSYAVTLDETAGWRHDSFQGAAASEQEIRAVLTQPSGLEIRGEHANWDDTGNLDNVVWCD